MTNQFVEALVNKARLLIIQPIQTILKFGLVGAVLIAFPRFTKAAHPDILVDFTVSGQPVSSPDVFGHYWNNMTTLAAGAGITNLITTNNSATTITLANVNISSLAANNVGPTSVDTNRLGYFRSSMLTALFITAIAARAAIPSRLPA